MSDPVEMRFLNLNLLHVSFTPTSGTAISFECISKDSLPRLKNNTTFSVVTDAMQVGKTVVGTSEGFESFSFVIPTDANLVFTQLQKLQATNATGALSITYNDGTKTDTIPVPNCVIIGVEPGGGDNNSASSTTVTFQPTDSIASTNTAAPFTLTQATNSAS